MRFYRIGAVVAIVGLLGMSSAMASKQVCLAQQAAAKDLVEARDAEIPKEDVVAEVRKKASSQASANVLAESVDAIYADAGMDAGAAGSMILERCLAVLGQ